jgi:hypothetical protein
MTSNTINKLVLAGFKKKGTAPIMFEKSVKHPLIGSFFVQVYEEGVYVWVGDIIAKKVATTTTNLKKILRQLEGL